MAHSTSVPVFIYYSRSVASYLHHSHLGLIQVPINHGMDDLNSTCNVEYCHTSRRYSAVGYSVDHSADDFNRAMKASAFE